MCASTTCIFPTTRAADPEGSQLRGAGRQDGRDRRPVRRRQIDHLAAAVPLLRRLRRQILIDGQDIRDVTQAVAARRDRHGAAGHGAVQRHHPLQHRYGRWDASDAEVEEAARLAQIDGFIRMSPKGYETQVGERGLKLSGGEKQRVAIARTILKAPPILVLDEATSALDSHTEREIQGALERVSRNRTSLVIAHRLSTIVGADEIIVLDQGRIAERGPSTTPSRRPRTRSIRRVRPKRPVARSTRLSATRRTARTYSETGGPGLPGFHLRVPGSCRHF
jgi:ABC-type dipeptide/oligopeptide/nickel transport system ATPase component